MDRTTYIILCLVSLTLTNTMNIHQPPLQPSIFVIYNADDGDFYCAASSVEIAEQIIVDDRKAGYINEDDNMAITDLSYWTEQPTTT
jgi:hypothetical protein